MVLTLKGKPFQIEDISLCTEVSSVSLSPDDSKILCVISTIDIANNCVKDVITLIDVETRKQETLTAGRSPSWSPNGLQIAYEGEDGALWIYDLKQQLKRFLTQIYQSDYFMGHMAEKNFCWSPDGLFIAYLSAFSYEDVKNETEKTVYVTDRLLYKTKGGRGRVAFTDDQLTHIWIVSLLDEKSVLLTDGSYNEHSISWASDSQHISFVSNRSGDPDNNQFHDLWTVNIKIKEVLRYTHNFGTVFQPSCSPDGKMIAFIATTNKISTNDSPSEDSHLYVLYLENGAVDQLATALDRRIENIRWHPAGEFIYFTAGSEGKTSIYRVSHQTDALEIVITGEQHILEYALSTAGNDIVYVSTSINQPSEIFLSQQNKHGVQISNLNSKIIDNCSLKEADTFWFKSFDGTAIQGWLMKPTHFENKKKYPVVLIIHGGPHNMYGYEFDEKMQLLSGNGYGILFINPRGSSGYGQAFSNGCVMSWGDGDYKDLMHGLDYVLATTSWIDHDKLGVTGQSYGGYMTNWIITQTNRFKAAVVDGGISNLVSFAGTSLYHSLIESEFNGSTYDNFPRLWQCSPLRNVKNVITPTLFLHGETDNEVPIGQAEEMYIALKKLNVRSSFVRYIGEGHGWRPNLTPRNKIDLYKRMIDWFNQME
ncbi:S9 family peptidase [Pedobacter immunditicola]|uniref:S9 family peptidase n=1 Tax=Pedobacter immunditicola TaxID=3133440 RepID=UPI0030ACE8C3